ncbi:hypothetical protein PF010_g12203 [Phytophthora fragariae]|uniref:Uncharacterized protein n=1 Tax=Phytophthora fragariae TaxID=53985 RepID=A0A6A3FJ08_9STRA|nr:hypothetical protein PF009_g4616 [Phytophthora fragariae]KAE9107641.1 hypothetical protein PF010_g12203 [Phytophthora fragariae]KAE9131547.1 hypothetical protein PF007_g4103 [Phytophthora fragariae]KAE9250189.1 hypothetical protein PF002_g4886 [Phytophthora fragariae]KAE9306633.1 hypothetical protein PF001_g12033 [Phytophthora fragariae]
MLPTILAQPLFSANRVVQIRADVPEEFDCVLGMQFFVDVQPEIDWKRRCFKDDVTVGATTTETSTPVTSQDWLMAPGFTMLWTAKDHPLPAVFPVEPPYQKHGWRME